MHVRDKNSEKVENQLGFQYLFLFGSRPPEILNILTSFAVKRTDIPAMGHDKMTPDLPIAIRNGRTSQGD